MRITEQSYNQNRELGVTQATSLEEKPGSTRDETPRYRTSDKQQGNQLMGRLKWDSLTVDVVQAMKKPHGILLQSAYVCSRSRKREEETLMRQLRLDCLMEQTGMQNILRRSYLLLFRLCDDYLPSQDQRMRLKFILGDDTNVEFTQSDGASPVVVLSLVPRSFRLRKTCHLQRMRATK